MARGLDRPPDPLRGCGHVYVSEPFAAAIALDPTHEVDCDYVGTIPTAKDFGDLPMYLLRKRDTEIANPVEAAYRRGDLLEKRKALMAAWEDFICNSGAKAVATDFKARRALANG